MTKVVCRELALAWGIDARVSLFFLTTSPERVSPGRVGVLAARGTPRSGLAPHVGQPLHASIFSGAERHPNVVRELLDLVETAASQNSWCQTSVSPQVFGSLGASDREDACKNTVSAQFGEDTFR